MPSPALAATWGADQWQSYILDHLAVESAVLNSGARRIDITGKQAYIPRLNTDGTASWTAELAEITSSAPDADTILLAPKKLANVVTVSTESIEDSDVSVLNGVGDALARSLAVALDTSVFDAVAAGATRPAGLRNAAAYTLPGVVGTTSDAAGVDSILTGIGAIRAAGGKANAIYAAGADITALTLLKEATGSLRGLLQPDPVLEGRYALGGATFYAIPGLPAGTAVIADSSQLIVGVRKDVSVDFSTDAAFTKDGVVIRVTGRFDWDVNDTDGIYVIA